MTFIYTTQTTRDNHVNSQQYSTEEIYNTIAYLTNITYYKYIYWFQDVLSCIRLTTVVETFHRRIYFESNSIIIEQGSLRCLISTELERCECKAFCSHS